MELRLEGGISKMVNDLTLIYYSANVIPEITAERIRENLLLVTKGQYPIISVTQKPIDFGKNICIGELGQSKYNEYKQILIGAKEAKTKYIACVEDDALYAPEHFTFRPPADTFGYEMNYWFAQLGQDFYWRHSKGKMSGMLGCIVETDTLIKNLTKRYEMYPTNPWDKDPDLRLQFGEPAYYDENFGMENKRVMFSSDKPGVMFIHGTGMGSVQLVRFRRRYGDPLPENKCYNLEGFGNAKELIDKYWK
jgi:hypothetical protein